MIGSTSTGRQDHLPRFRSATRIEQARRAQAATARPRLLHAGDHLFEMGVPLKGVYQVKAGTIKSYTISPDGDQQIVGFHVPGDLIGIDALADGRSRTAAQALDTASVIFVPFGRLFGASRAEGEVEQQLLSQLSDTLERNGHLMLLLARKSASQRLAWFLLDLGERMRRRGLSATEFTLPMSRTDIANFLGLAMETVCRELSRLKADGTVVLDRRRILILEPSRLAARAGLAGVHTPMTPSADDRWQHAA